MLCYGILLALADCLVHVVVYGGFHRRYRIRCVETLPAHCTRFGLPCSRLIVSVVLAGVGGGALGKANPARLEPHHRPCACHGAASAMCSFSHVHAMVQQLALNVCALGNQYISRHHWRV